MAAVPAELEKAREKQAMADERSRQKAVRDAKEAAERKAVAAADKKCMPDLAACKRACDDGDLLMCVAYGGNQKDDAAGLAEAKPVLQKACDAGESVGCAYLKTVLAKEAQHAARTKQLWVQVETTVDDIAARKAQMKAAQTFSRSRRNVRALGMMKKHLASVGGLERDHGAQRVTNRPFGKHRSGCVRRPLPVGEREQQKGTCKPLDLFGSLKSLEARVGSLGGVQVEPLTGDDDGEPVPFHSVGFYC